MEPQPRIQKIYEDEDILVVDKPSGILSIPDRDGNPSLKTLLDTQYPEIYTVHRLDRDTSGVMVFAKNANTHKYLSQSFEGRTVEKYYTAIVIGSPIEDSGMIDAPIAPHHIIKGKMRVDRSGKPSQTGYEVLERNAYFSKVLFRLYTGRTHQIRVHALHQGFPIACDTLYGDGKSILLSQYKRNYKLSKHQEDERPILDRLGLHASKLHIPMQDGRVLVFESVVPKPFLALMKQLSR